MAKKIRALLPNLKRNKKKHCYYLVKNATKAFDETIKSKKPINNCIFFAFLVFSVVISHTLTTKKQSQHIR